MSNGTIDTIKTFSIVALCVLLISGIVRAYSAGLLDPYEEYQARFQYIETFPLTTKETASLYKDKTTGYHYIKTGKGFARLWMKGEK